MKQYQRLGQTIRFFRQLKKMNQDTLAIGICTSSYLSRIENGLLEADEVVYEMLFERLQIDLEMFIETGNQIDTWLENIYEDLLSNKELKEEQLGQLKELYVKRNYPNLQIKVDLIYARYLLSINQLVEANEIVEPIYRIIKPSMTREWQVLVAVQTFIDLSHHQFDDILNRELQTNSEYYFSTINSFEKANYLYHLAFASHRAYEFPKAKKYIEKAKYAFQTNFKPLFQVKLLSMNGVIWNALGQIELAIKDFEAAIEWLHQVPSIATNEQWASIYNNLAFTYESKQDYVLAQKYYEQSLIYESSLHTKINYARSLFLSGELTKLEERLLQLEKEYMDCSSHHYYQYQLIQAITSGNLEEFNKLERLAFKHFIENNHLELILTYGPKVVGICEEAKQYKRSSEIYRLLYETTKMMLSRATKGELE